MSTAMDDWITLVEDCENREQRLSDWERQFIDSVRHQLDADHPITVPQRHAGESDLDYLRRTEVSWGLWQSDALKLIRKQADQIKGLWDQHHRDSAELRSLCAARDAAKEIARQQADRIADLEREIANLHTTMMAAAVEIHEHWDAHCDAEGYGPANLMHRLERGIASQYGYDAKTLQRVEAERDTLRTEVERLHSAVRAFCDATSWSAQSWKNQPYIKTLFDIDAARKEAP